RRRPSGRVGLGL
ncbi:hypothetical protein AB1N83_011198, partial [Pleurotus pulmonarius]